MSLTRAELMLSDAFDFGQCYVALSRVTSLEGLWIRRAWCARTRACWPSTARWDASLTEVKRTRAASADWGLVTSGRANTRSK